MTRGTHSTVEQAPVVGDAVGRYRIIGVLGDGRLGRLYVAEQHEIRGVSKIVALRCIRPEIARRAQFRARFLEAARVATRCDHPNVVSVFELGNADGRYFIGMEYLPGENVASIVARCNTRDAMPADIAAYVVKQAATALQYLHDLREGSPQRVSTRHDEVDPSNVFVSYHGMVKWLGFGLRAFGGESASPDSERLDGPPSSSSQLETDPVGGSNVSSPASTTRALPSSAAEIDTDAERRADVLGLGRLLWTCLTGEKPAAPAAGTSSPARQVQAPRSLRADVPAALDLIASRALSPDPRDRFESPRAMADELDRYLLQRESRPTPKHLRRWMEQLFDIERASLQMQIARGRDVEAALAHLGAPPDARAGQAPRAFTSPRPRELWSTGHAMFSQFSRATLAPPRSFERAIGGVPDESRVTAIPHRHFAPSSSSSTSSSSSGFASAPVTLANAELPPLEPPRQPPARSSLAGTLLVAAAMLGIGALVLVTASPDRSPLDESASGAAAVDRSARLDIRSNPEGASVFIDGEPTGLRTPVVLKGLAAGRNLRVRVDKAGYTSQEQTLELSAGSLASHTFELTASAGRVQLAGVPRDARVFIDDALVSIRDGAPVSLSVGRHNVRVETPSALLFSGTVDVIAGEQTVQVGGAQTP